MFKKVVNLPFRVLGRAARAVQEHQDAAMKARYGDGEEGDDFDDLSNVPPTVLPDDYDPGDTQVSVDQALAWMKSSREVAFVDVRPLAAHRSGHVVHALHNPAATLSIRLSELPPETTTLVIFGDEEAEDAVRLLRYRGYEDCWLLEGGLEAWRAGGGEVQTS